MRQIFGIINKSEVDNIIDYCKRYFGELTDDDIERVIDVRDFKVTRYHISKKEKLFGCYYYVADVDIQQMILDKYYIQVTLSAQYNEENEVSYTFTAKKFCPNSFAMFKKIFEEEYHETDIRAMFNDIVRINELNEE